MNWHCPVTGGLPTRMSYDGFVAACRARQGRAGCEEWCGGMPQELEIIKGWPEMGKTIKEQIAEAIAPVKAELEGREAWVAVLEDTLAGTKEELAGAKARIAELEAALNDARAWAAELQDDLNARNAELAAAKAAVEDRIERTPVDLVDMSAAIYRDALADFAIRVLSGGVAVSFHEARRP